MSKPSDFISAKCSYPLDDESFVVHGSEGDSASFGREAFMRIRISLAETLCAFFHKLPANKEGVVVDASDDTDEIWVVTCHDGHYFLIKAYMEA